MMRDMGRSETKPARTAKRRKLKTALAVETVPDAWGRFTGAVAKIAPPRRRKPKTTKS
jgi:hypothetical protein